MDIKVKKLVAWDYRYLKIIEHLDWENVTYSCINNSNYNFASTFLTSLMIFV